MSDPTNPDYERGYQAGFEDGVNDAAKAVDAALSQYIKGGFSGFDFHALNAKRTELKTAIAETEQRMMEP